MISQHSASASIQGMEHDEVCYYRTDKKLWETIKESICTYKKWVAACYKSDVDKYLTSSKTSLAKHFRLKIPKTKIFKRLRAEPRLVSSLLYIFRDSYF